MNKYLLSIVVPIYGVENELPALLGLLSQIDQKNVEILLIDDGSKDNSGKIIDEFAEKFNTMEVRALHKENGGLSDARNYGLQKSQGEFIWFLDSDDLFNLQYMFQIIQIIEENKKDIDIVWFDHIDFTNEDDIPSRIDSYIESDYEYEMVTGNELIKLLSLSRVENYVWSYIVKRKILLDHKIYFPKGRKFEDVATTYKIFDNVKNAIKLNTPVYFYRIRQGSIVNTNSLENASDLLISTREMNNYFFKKEKDEKILNGLLLKHFTLAYLLLRESKNNTSRKEFSKLEKEIKKEIKNLNLKTFPMVKQIARMMILCDLYIPATKFYSFSRRVIFGKKR